MPQFDRHFTLAEARALLSELRRAFARIHALLEDIQKKRGEQEGAVMFFSANGHGPRVTGGDEGQALAEVQKIVDEIHEKGIFVKDLKRGLCDFPYFRPSTGEEVFLCWELSDADLAYWHTIEGNYSGRRPLEE